MFDAFKTVETTVRKRGSYPESLVGVKLMRMAFDPDNGPLRDPAALPERRRAIQNLYMGAMGGLRNPKGHNDPTITDPREAIEDIITASLLLRMIKT